MTDTLARLPVDADLERLLHDLRPVAMNLRRLEQHLIQYDEGKQYRFIGHHIRLLADAEQVFKSEAKRMAMRWGSLLLFVEEAAELKRIMGRKPTLAQLQRAIEGAQRVRRRDRSTREAARVIAEFNARQAAEVAADGDDAIRYLEASCG